MTCSVKSAKNCIKKVGCVRCLEAVFRRLKGVKSVRSGYAGGPAELADYHSVCSGETGHAEVIRLQFDPAEIGYHQLLEVFFAMHDPTTLNRQGHDVGSQYRSVIFAHDDAQLATAREVIATLAAGQAFDDPIVTQLVPAAPFYPAEDHHHQYFDLHPEQGYCQVVIAPKVRKLLTHWPTTSSKHPI